MNFLTKKNVIKLIIFLILLFSFASIVYANNYQTGLQYIYPYYNTNESQASSVPLNEYLQTDIPNDLNTVEKINYFNSNYLALNELGAIAFSTALYSVSNHDHNFNKNGHCGIAGWDCSGQRWQNLIDSSQDNNLDYLSLEGQLMFINHELNGLAVYLVEEENSEINSGAYNEVWEILLRGDDIEIMFDELSSSYLETSYTTEELIELAKDLYDYDESVEYNLYPSSPSYNPQNQTREFITIEGIDDTDCSSGLGGKGYIERVNDEDHLGPLLYKVEPSEGGSGSFDNHHVHRCIYDTVIKMLADLNQYTLREEGVTVKFESWRSHARQIQLRKINGCPDTYTAPSSECKTATARPGKSNHQDGLALDFKCYDENGRLVPVFQYCKIAYNWLQCYGADYGFIELDTTTVHEPWHWDYHTTTRRQPVKTC